MWLGNVDAFRIGGYNNDLSCQCKDGDSEVSIHCVEHARDVRVLYAGICNGIEDMKKWILV